MGEAETFDAQTQTHRDTQRCTQRYTHGPTQKLDICVSYRNTDIYTDPYTFRHTPTYTHTQVQTYRHTNIRRHVQTPKDKHIDTGAHTDTLLSCAFAAAVAFGSEAQAKSRAVQPGQGLRAGQPTQLISLPITTPGFFLIKMDFFIS